MKFYLDADGVYHTAKSRAGENPTLVEIKPDKPTILRLLNSVKTEREHAEFCMAVAKSMAHAPDCSECRWDSEGKESITCSEKIKEAFFAAVTVCHEFSDGFLCDAKTEWERWSKEQDVE